MVESGLLAFVVFATFFELVLDISHLGIGVLGVGTLGPAVLILAGPGIRCPWRRAASLRRVGRDSLRSGG